MRAAMPGGVWSCSSCAALLLAALLGRGARASHAGPKRDLVHRVAKAQVTAPPLARRDASTCQADYSLCPDTLGGGCCPPQYQCATDSCYATTAGIASACGKVGWFACDLADSGGCCPVGYLCGPTDCTVAVGNTNTITTCPVNMYLCPASYNYGCCSTGMGCASNACYSTSPVTETFTQTITTTAAGQIITTTRTAVTVAVPSPPSGLPATDANIAPKFIPTSVPKTSAISTPSGDTGLTSSQLGGIVGGVVALLLVVLAAAFLIIRRLNHVADALGSSKKETSSQKTMSRSLAEKQAYGGHLHLSTPYVDDTSIDPLMITPNTNNNSGAGTPPTHGGGGGHRYPGGGRDRSDSNQFSPDARYPSVDSAQGYFDLPPRVHNIPGGRHSSSVSAGAGPVPLRSSVDSHSTQGGQYTHLPYHTRNMSSASELSADGSEGAGHGVMSPLVIPELDSSGAFVELPTMTLADGRRSGSSVGGLSNTGGLDYQSRSRSNSAVVGARRRSEGGGAGGGIREGSPPAPTPGVGVGLGFGPLDVVSESAEIMHGYYGPRDRQVGQTAAGLEGSPVSGERDRLHPHPLPQEPEGPFSRPPEPPRP